MVGRLAVLLFSVPLIAAAAGFSAAGPDSWVSLSGEAGAPPEWRLEGSSENGFTLVLEVPGFWLTEMPGSGAVYSRAELPESPFDEFEPGLPELPVVPLLFSHPPGTEPVIADIRVEGESVLEGVLLYPTQPPTTDGPSGGAAFVGPEAQAYGSESPWPEKRARIDSPGNWGGMPVARLAVSPLSWTAAERKLNAAARIEVDVVFEGSAEAFPAISEPIQRLHRSRIINHGDLPVPSAGLTDDDGAEYLLITNEDNLAAVTPLARLQNVLGNRVQVVVLPNPATSAQIEDKVDSVYQEGVTRFVVIAGPHQELPSHAYAGFYGDYWYACVDPDNYPDVAVGRFSDTAADLPNQVDKLVSYMSHTGTEGETSIPATAALAAHEEDYPGKYTANKNYIKNYSYSLTDIAFDTFYPPEGATAAQLAARINENVGTVNYRGHGQATHWQWSPGWNAGNIYALTNTFFPPVFNVACLNGEHNLAYNCLAESWMAAPGVGASGTLGASASSYTTPNNTLDKTIYWSLYRDGITRAGEAMDAGRVAMMTAYPYYGSINARMYHWFGDPAQDIFNCDETGSPFGLELAGPAFVNAGPQSVTYTVTSQGSPVDGAVVCASDGVGNHPDDPEGFYACDTTDSSGEAVLAFNGTEGDSVLVGAWKHNFAFDTLGVDVGQEGVETDMGGPAPLALAAPSPNPSRGSISLAVAGGGVAPVALEAYDAGGRLVARRGPQDLQAGWNSLSWDLSGLPSGLYVVRARSGADVSESRKLVILGGGL
jgi:hypothetical protein